MNEWIDERIAKAAYAIEEAYAPDQVPHDAKRLVADLRRVIHGHACRHCGGKTPCNCENDE